MKTKKPPLARGCFDCRNGWIGSVPVASATAAVAAATTATTTVAAAATTTATAPESAAATTTAATESTAATTAAAPALFARAGFVDGEGPAVVLVAVQRRDRRLGFLIGAHLDEAESLGPAGV